MSSKPALNLPDEYKRADFGVKLLEKISIFKNFPPDDLARVYNMGELRTFNPGVNIIIEGETSAGLYIVIDGMVGVYKTTAQAGLGNRLSTMGAGKSFGEMSLIDKRPRSATVAADTQVVTYYLDGNVWDESSAKDLKLRCAFYENCAVLLSARLREIDDEFILSQKQLWRLAISRAIAS